LEKSSLQIFFQNIFYYPIFKGFHQAVTPRVRTRLNEAEMHQAQIHAGYSDAEVITHNEHLDRISHIYGGSVEHNAPTYKTDGL
jgi:hypothetical protein